VVYSSVREKRNIITASA